MWVKSVKSVKGAEPVSDLARKTATRVQVICLSGFGGYLALMGITSLPSKIRGGIPWSPVPSRTPVTEFTVYVSWPEVASHLHNVCYYFTH
jgi:hypothetical protein